MKFSAWLACAVAGLLVAAAPSAAAEFGADMEAAFGRNAGVTVQGIRLGQHPDKLRIVLDATGPVNFDYWISEGGRGIVVLIPQVKWAADEYVRMHQDSRIYRIRFFPNPTGGGVLSILGRDRLGLSGIEQIGPGKNMPHRVVFDIPTRTQDAWVPGGGIMRSGKLLPGHADWPPVQQARAGRALPVVTRASVAREAVPVAAPDTSPVSNRESAEDTGISVAKR